MKPVMTICLLVCALGAFGEAMAQERGSGASAVTEGLKQPERADGVPLERLIATVAKKSGKKFIVDNRVSGNVEILGQDVSAVNYGDLLSILLLNGFTAIEGSDYVGVIPISGVRAEPLPLATAKDKFPDAQFVTMVVPVKTVLAASLVPILRPLLPTYAHLAAMPCINSMLIVDNFANVKRLEKLITTLDVGKQQFVPSPCEGEGARPQGNGAK
jgi:type II secretory pathway component GspD/PulD (secretin)